MTGWTWLDAALSLGIGAAIVVGTWGLLVEFLFQTLEWIPKERLARVVGS